MANRTSGGRRRDRGQAVLELIHRMGGQSYDVRWPSSPVEAVGCIAYWLVGRTACVFSQRRKSKRRRGSGVGVEKEEEEETRRREGDARQRKIVRRPQQY